MQDVIDIDLISDLTKKKTKNKTKKSFLGPTIYQRDRAGEREDTYIVTMTVMECSGDGEYQTCTKT